MKKLILGFCAVLLLGLAVDANAQSVTVNLGWTDTNSGQTQEDGTKIEQKIDTEVYRQVAQVAANITVYSTTVANPFPGQHNICYRVKAFNAVGESPYSNEVCAVTPVVLKIAPLAPGNLTIQLIP